MPRVTPDAAYEPAHALGAGIGIGRQQQHGLLARAVLDIGGVDPGIRQHEAQTMHDDDGRRAAPAAPPADSCRMSSTSRGSFSTVPASSRARAEGETSARRTRRPSALETIFCASDQEIVIGERHAGRARPHRDNGAADRCRRRRWECRRERVKQEVEVFKLDGHDSVFRQAGEADAGGLRP